MVSGSQHGFLSLQLQGLQGILKIIKGSVNVSDSLLTGFQDLIAYYSDDRFCMLVYPGIRNYMGSVSPSSR